MIIVKNRELLIPANERYIGTPLDNFADNRVFRIKRFSQSGEDLSSLTFRLDLKYPSARQVYTFNTSASHTGGSAVVLAKTFVKTYAAQGTYVFTFTGSAWQYSGNDVDLEDIGIVINFTPVSSDTVTVVSTISTVMGDTVLLTKEIADEYINLLWEITENQTAVPGTVFIALRGSDADASVKYASFYGAFYVETNLDQTALPASGITELEQLENMTAEGLRKLEYLYNRYQDLDAAALDAEAYAKGTVDGVPVGSGDPGYHDNSYYWSLISQGWAKGGTATHPNEETDNSKYWSQQSNINGQRWATGEVDGTPVPSTDPAYQNSSKHWAEESDKNGERWSVGQIDGVDVPSTDPTYQNNAKYYSEAADIAGEKWARGTADGTPVGSGDETYHNNAKYYSEVADANGEKWARGTVDGVPVGSGDETYHDNSKYWSLVSQGWAKGGTGTRPDAETDNSKYWSEVSHAYANQVSYKKIYANVAEMVADTELIDGQVVRTLGYYAVNDDGGALYRIYSTVPATYYETISNGLYAELIYPGFVTPEMFGAKGDGSTDDSSAIQSAIDSGIPVHFASKTYLVSTNNTEGSYAVELKNGTAVIGTGKTIIRMSNSVTIGRIFKSSGVSGAINKIKISDIVFEGSCSFETDDETGLCAVELSYSSGTITECAFDGFNKNIELASCANVLVQGNHIKNATETAQKINGYGVLIEGGNDIHVSGNIMENIERHAVYINQTKHVSVCDNTIYGQTNNLSRYSRYEGNIKVDGSEDVFICKNELYGNYYAVMLLEGFVTNVAGINIIISNNVIAGVIGNGGFPWGGIGVQNNADVIGDNIIIENNIITAPDENPALSGIFFDTGHITNLHIRGNTVTGFMRGIRLRHLDSQIELSNNIVLDCTTGYDLSDATARLMLVGAKNFYKNCTTPVSSTELAMVNSRCDGIFPMDVTGDVSISGENITVDAFSGTAFSSATPATVKTISGGFEGQELFFRSAGSGTPRFNMADVTNIKIKSDFIPTTGDYILLKKSAQYWYEVAR